jgi:hypothetical protein
MRVEINKEYEFSEDQFLWRYMDLHRLIYFLNSENLFFSPLNSFYDPLEGITEKHLQDKQFLDFLEKKTEKEEEFSDRSEEELNEEKEEIKEKFKSHLEEIQKRYFASCWYLGVRESLAMWNTYSNKDSVAMKFKPNELCSSIIEACKSLDNDEFDQMVHGKVEYFKISPFDPNDKGLKHAKHRFKGFLKDLSYKHEEEFRFLAVQNSNKNTYSFFELSLPNIHDLDFNILTHPNMEPWKHNNICHILETKGLEKKLVKSEIPTRRAVFETP